LNEAGAMALVTFIASLAKKVNADLQRSASPGRLCGNLRKTLFKSVKTSFEGSA